MGFNVKSEILNIALKRLDPPTQKAFLGMLASRETEDTEGSAKILPWKGARGGTFSEEPFQTVWERNSAYESERAAAPERFSQLMAQPEGPREELVASDEQFHSLALCEHILDRAREASFQEPDVGEELARLGLVIARYLDSDFYGRRLLQDLEARIWSEIANARRLASDLAGAEEVLGRAESVVAGTPDPLEVARILSLKATLRKDQRSFREALEIRNRALAIYRRCRQAHSVGRELTNKASDLLELGEPDPAIDCLSEAIDVLDPDLEPRAYVGAHHNLVWALVDQDRFLEAAEAFPALQKLYSEADPAIQSRKHWLSGRIASGLGRLKEAEKALTTARDEFRTRDIPYDFALVSLELALVYARQDRIADVRRLAAEMLPIFESRRIHREALAALNLFHRAAEREALTVGTLRKIIQRLEDAPRQVGSP